MRGLAQDGGEIMNADRRVADLMTTGVRTCAPDDTIKSVMAEMTRRRFRHMPVVEGGRLTGLISIGDAVKSRLDEMELETRGPARGLHRGTLRQRFAPCPCNEPFPRSTAAIARRA